MKVAIITGAAGGIGKETALLFARKGYAVALFDVDAEGLKTLKKEVEELNGEVLDLKVDITSMEDVKRGIDETMNRWGRIDVLVNNAGITKDTFFIRMSEEDWRKVLEINLNGSFNMTKVVIPIMLKQRSGVIINVSSVIGIMGNAGQTNYAASKAALIAFTKSLAKEVGPRGIRVMAIAPGFIETPMTQKLKEEIRESYISQIPLRRAGTPRDVANLIFFLASEEASYITGQVYVIDGGMT